MFLSTGLRNYQLVTGSAKAALDGFYICIYDGPVPADADAALVAGNNQLIKYDAGNGDGTLCTFEATAASGVLNKNSAEVWSNDVAITGDPTFYRLEKAADTGAASTTALRVQGTAGIGAKGIVTSSQTLLVGTPQRLNSFYLALPKGS